MRTPILSKNSGMAARNFGPCLLLFALFGCAITQPLSPEAKLRERTDSAHAGFRARPGWQQDTYRDEEVLARAGRDNIRVEIGLEEQRGLLLVDNLIAIDFPVATGRRAFPTPPGKYHILEKKQTYASNLYGKIVDGEGNVVVTDADSRVDSVPAGGAFIGASMPMWMRLTNGGVGMHIGYVPIGRPASHGCIRLRPQTAQTIFSLSRIGTPVTIAPKLPRLHPPTSGPS